MFRIWPLRIASEWNVKVAGVFHEPLIRWQVVADPGGCVRVVEGGRDAGTRGSQQTQLDL